MASANPVPQAQACPADAETVIGESARQVTRYETENHFVAICRTTEGDPYYHGIPKSSASGDLNAVTLPAYRSGKGYGATNKALTYTINDTELLITQVGLTLVQEPVLSRPDQEEQFLGRPQRGQPADWTLNFEADTTSGDRLAFALDLLKTQTTANRRATLAQGSEIGDFQFMQVNGRSLDLDAYQWAIDPKSSVYLGKSGYKHLLVLYNYGRGETTSYQLKMVCQTLASGAACQVADDGPLLNQDLTSQGQLSFGPQQLASNATFGTSSTKSDLQLQQIAPETTPDRALEQAILAQFSEQDQRSQTFRYVYNRADLNGDNDPEVFAYLEDSSFCQGQRCPLLVFSPQVSGYQLLTKLPLVSPPVIVSDSKTWGWRDVILSTENDAGEPQYRRLRYTGQQYPQSLSSAETVGSRRITGTALLSDRNVERPEVESDVEQPNIAPARSQGPASTTQGGSRSIYKGQGSLRVYPSARQKTEQQFDITQIQIAGESPTQLTLTITNPTRTVQVQGERTVTSSDEGSQLTINTIDNQPAQGMLFVGSDGTLKTLKPIWMGAEDQELSLSFQAQ